MLPPSHFRRFGATISLLVFAIASYAAESPDDATRVEAAGKAGLRFPVDMRGGISGRMRSASTGAELSVSHKAEAGSLYADYDFVRTRYEFAGAPLLPSHTTTDAHRAVLHGEWMATDDWGLFGTGVLVAGANTEVSLGSGLSGIGVVGAKHRSSDDFSQYVGVLYYDRLDTTPMILPVVAFDWRAGDWRVRTINGLFVSYDASGDESLVFEASVFYRSTFYRLTPHPFTRQRRAVDVQEVPLQFSVKKTFGEHFFVKLTAAFILWNDYRFSTNGATSVDFQTDPIPAFGITAGARF